MSFTSIEYKTHFLAKQKLNNEFEASKARAINATSLCEKVQKHDATILSDANLSQTVLNSLQSIHTEALNRATEMIQSFSNRARLDTLTLSGAFGTIENLLNLSIENSRNLILPHTRESSPSISSKLVSQRIGLPCWSPQDNCRSEKEKNDPWSLQGLPRRNEPKDAFIDPLISTSTAAFNSFRHNGRECFDPLFRLNPEPIKTSATTVEDGESRATLINPTENISITRFVSHERILSTFTKLIANEDHKKIDSPTPSVHLSPLSHNLPSVTPSTTLDSSVTTAILSLANVILSFPGDLNVSGLYDTIALSGHPNGGLETLTPAYVGIEEHFEEWILDYFFNSKSKKDDQKSGRTILMENPDQSYLKYYRQFQKNYAYEGISLNAESAMKNERRFWENIFWRNDENKGAEVDLSLSMIKLGFEWIKDEKNGVHVPFLCQYPSLIGKANILGSCIGSIKAHSELKKDPSVFAGALGLVTDSYYDFNADVLKRNVVNDNKNIVHEDNSPINLVNLKRISNNIAIPAVSAMSALSFASSWKVTTDDAGVNSRNVNHSYHLANASSMVRRLLRLSAILCAYKDQLDEEAVFLSTLRSKIDKKFDLSPILAAIRCFVDRDGSPTKDGGGFWGVFNMKRLNDDLRDLKRFSSLAQLSPQQLEEFRKVLSFLRFQLGVENDPRSGLLIRTILFGSQSIVHESIGSLIIRGMLHRIMNKSDENTVPSLSGQNSLHIAFSYNAALIAFHYTPHSISTTYGPDARIIKSFLQICTDMQPTNLVTTDISPPSSNASHMICIGTNSTLSSSSPTGGSPGRKTVSQSASLPLLSSSHSLNDLPSSSKSLSSLPIPPPPLPPHSFHSTSLDFISQASESMSPPLASPPSKLCAICQTPGSSRCSLCQLVIYCSKTCQTQAWKEHKQICNNKNMLTSEMVQSLLRTTDKNINL